MSRGETKQLHRRWLIGGFLLLLIFAAILLPEILGRKYWEKTKAELTAKGEKLFAGDLRKPPLPKDNYFAMPYFSTRGGDSAMSNFLGKAIEDTLAEHDVFSAVQKNRVGDPVSLETFATGLPVGATQREKQSEMIEWMERMLPFEMFREEVIEESRRPDSHVIDLDSGLVDTGLSTAARNLGAYIRFHAIAALAKKDLSDAMEDIRLLNRLAQALSRESSIVNAATAFHIWTGANCTMLEGMHLWTDDQLMQLDLILKKPPFDRGQGADILRVERALFNTTVGDFSSFDIRSPKEIRFPPISAFTVLANYNLSQQEFIEMLENPASTPTDFDSFESAYVPPGKLADYQHSFTSMTQPMSSQYVRAVFACSDQARLTRVTIALERYLRKNGGYPKKLEELIPQYMESLPEGTLPGQTINYLPATGGYKIWTYGWNGSDEGGMPSKAGERTGDNVLQKVPAP